MSDTLTWSQGTDPVNADYPAWYTSEDTGDLIAYVRVGDFATFLAPGFTYEATAYGVTFSGHVATIEEAFTEVENAVDAAAEAVVEAYVAMMGEDA